MMKNKAMNLNNQISQMQNELQEVEKRKSTLQAQAEENTHKRMNKVSEVGQILMSINNLYQECKEREGTRIKVAAEDNFDDVQGRGERALEQLTEIHNKLEDFKAMIFDIEKKDKTDPELKRRLREVQ